MKFGNTTDSHGGCRGPTAGITSLEVAIIVVVIVVLVVILCPVLYRGREPVRKPSCQRNLKSLGTAFSMYQSDYDGMLPSSYLWGRSKTWNRSDFAHFASERGVFPPDAAPPTHPQTWAMLLYPYMKLKDIIWCPSDPNSSNDREDVTLSYFYKAAVDRAWYGDGKTRMRNVNDFAFQADQVVFYERTDWHHGRESMGLADGVSLNMVFMDGHVETKKVINSGGAAVTPAPSAGEPAWFNCKDDIGFNHSTGPHWNPNVWFDYLP